MYEERNGTIEKQSSWNVTDLIICLIYHMIVIRHAFFGAWETSDR